jgi:hypothetical protein
MLEHRAVLDEVKAKAGQLSSRMWGPGSQIAGTRSRWLRVASTSESVLSVLHAKGARPLTLWASAISPDQPSRLTASLDEPGTGHRLDHRATDSPLDLVEPTSKRPQRVGVGPDGELTEAHSHSQSRQTSSFLRLRSSPACNMGSGPPWCFAGW